MCGRMFLRMATTCSTAMPCAFSSTLADVFHSSSLCELNSACCRVLHLHKLRRRAPHSSRRALRSHEDLLSVFRHVQPLGCQWIVAELVTSLHRCRRESLSSFGVTWSANCQPSTLVEGFHQFHGHGYLEGMEL